ncbi:hypothetical protein [Embleya sp. NPDC059237]|uniref:hypothetical protein n=1 Tax=Embleya sp. NPDC059237 TaxID=3346784 RepID=UPI0036760C84
MGGSGWSYVVPYREDVGAALEALRAEEFAAGHNWSPTDWDLPAPASPDDLWQNELYWEFMGTHGTHSVLDVNRVIDVGEDHDFGTVRPLAASVIREGFGSDRPSRADFDGMDFGTLDALDDALRWSGHCMVLYRDGIPHEIAFWGVSGD